MIAFSNSKINLGLHIFDKREDGYHNIESVFYPINWCDTLEIIKSNKQEKIIFNSYGLTINTNPENNLIVKAYHLLNADFNLPPVESFIIKNIPMGAGLGGGSANAAHALIMLNKLCQLNLTKAQLATYAAKLGADCAFFILNKPAYTFGTGSLLEPIAFSLKGYYLVVTKPDIHIGTQEAYSNAFKRGVKNDQTTLKDVLNQPIEEWKNHLFNDFEQSVSKTYPIINDIKNTFYQNGAVYASMSGSGSAVYGLFKQEVNLKEKFNHWHYHAEWCIL